MNQELFPFDTPPPPSLPVPFSYWTLNFKNIRISLQVISINWESKSYKSLLYIFGFRTLPAFMTLSPYAPNHCNQPDKMLRSKLYHFYHPQFLMAETKLLRYGFPEQEGTPWNITEHQRPPFFLEPRNF